MTAHERIVGRPECGWIATGRCGQPHLVGGGWAWWLCPVCAALKGTARARSKDRITAAQARLLAYYYPPPP